MTINQKEKPRVERPDIFSYLDYRTYLTEMLQYLSKQKKMKRREVSARSGLKSTSNLSMIIKGQRKILPERARRIGEALLLSKSEISFFETLVLFTQAKDAATRDRLYNAMLKSRSFRRVQEAKREQYEVFSKWHVVALLEGLAGPWRNERESHIAESLGISAQELQVSLRTLEVAGLIAKVGGRWIRQSPVIQTAEETQSLSIRNFHRQMLSKAIESMDRHQSPMRSMQALTVAMSLTRMQSLQEKIRAFLAEINADDSEPAQDTDVLIQINAHYFPLAIFAKRDLK